MGTQRVDDAFAARPGRRLRQWLAIVAVRSQRLVLMLLAGGSVAACGAFPTPMLGGEAIVLQVANASVRPVALSVASPEDGRTLVGSVDPPVVPPGKTVMAHFLVPPNGRWAISAGDDQLIGDGDVKGKRGQLPIGIDIDVNGNVTWWCQADCP